MLLSACTGSSYGSADSFALLPVHVKNAWTDILAGKKHLTETSNNKMSSVVTIDCI